MAMGSEEHNSAVQRLNSEVFEEARLAERRDAAVGTTGDLAARVELLEAGNRVAAREAWLNWVDDDGYHGLNAGPFELLAESSEP